MMASKTPAQPLWRRRWVWMSIAALAIFLAGITVGGGGHSDDSRCHAASVTTAVGHG